jgi:hypothetical protein
MRTEAQMTTIATRAMKDLHTDISRKYGFPPRVIAGATLGLAVELLFEMGYTVEQVVDAAKQFAEGTP